MKTEHLLDRDAAKDADSPSSSHSSHKRHSPSSSSQAAAERRDRDGSVGPDTFLPIGNGVHPLGEHEARVEALQVREDSTTYGTGEKKLPFSRVQTAKYVQTPH